MKNVEGRHANAGQSIATTAILDKLPAGKNCSYYRSMLEDERRQTESSYTCFDRIMLLSSEQQMDSATYSLLTSARQWPPSSCIALSFWTSPLATRPVVQTPLAVGNGPPAR